MIYAFDSNTISYLLRGEGNVAKYFARVIAQKGAGYAIPPMAVFEIKRWLLDKPTKVTRAYLSAFIDLLEPVRDKAAIDTAVWEKAAEIYIALKQRGQLIGDVDILIAGYCLENGYELVTRNTGDFKRIDGLIIHNWYD